MIEKRTICILLVEDDALDRMAVERTFRAKRLPYKLEFAETVAAAKKRLGQGRIDLVLVDQGLPDGTGLEIQQHLKGIPSIFLTGAEDPRTAVLAMKAGAYDYLVKDTAHEFLLLLPITIEKALHRKIEEDELLQYRQNLENLVAQRTTELKKVCERLQEEITVRKKSEDQIRTLSQAIEQSPVSVLIADTDAKIEYVNKTFENVTGYHAAEVIGQNPRILKSGLTPKNRYKALWEAITSGKSWQGELQNKKKNGEIFWEHAHIAPVLDEAGITRHYIAVKEDITRRKQQEEQLLHQAHYDILTNLPNRFLSLDRLSQLLNEAQRSKTMVAVLFLDLDDFKMVNDTLGHEAGDMLLFEAALRLSRVSRRADTVGRLGGDEFIVLVGGLTDPKDALPVVKNLIQQFRDPFEIDGRELILTASVGIAVFPEDGEISSELLRNADAAMYHAKELGRNTYAYFTDAMNREVSRRLVLEEQMHGALNRGEFTVSYQPQIDVSSGRMIGTEALLRWTNAALGPVSPLEFIPIAEKTGLIIPLGKFVLTTALGMAARLQQGHDSEFCMAVNLSPRQFRDPDLLPFIKKALDQSGVSGECLELEITEGVLMSSHGYIDKILAVLSKMGVSISMDDFGTGYSSLSYLRAYPFDVLKIDRSFVRDITVDPADQALIDATIAMAHGLNLKVVAEGVETEEQLAYLKKQGCDYAQGYLFAKPLPGDDLLEWVAKWEQS